MDRRNFLRGTLLTGTAGLIAPGVASLIGEERAEAATLAVVNGLDEPIPAPQAESMVRRLVERIYAHGQLFGEPPRALFVNRYEFRAAIQEMDPLTRFTNGNMADRGWNNVMVKGVPIVCIEHDQFALDPRGPL